MSVVDSEYITITEQEEMNIGILIKGLTRGPTDVSTQIDAFITNVTQWMEDSNSHSFTYFIEHHPFSRWIILPLNSISLKLPTTATDPKDEIDLIVNPLALLGKIDIFLTSGSKPLNGFFRDEEEDGGGSELYTNIGKELNVLLFDYSYQRDAAPVIDYSNYKKSLSRLFAWLEEGKLSDQYTLHRQQQPSSSTTPSIVDMRALATEQIKLPVHGGAATSSSNFTVEGLNISKFIILRVIAYIYYNRLYEDMGIYNLQNYWTNYTHAQRGEEYEEQEEPEEEIVPSPDSPTTSNPTPPKKTKEDPTKRTLFGDGTKNKTPPVSPDSPSLNDDEEENDEDAIVDIDSGGSEDDAAPRGLTEEEMDMDKQDKLTIQLEDLIVIIASDLYKFRIERQRVQTILHLNTFSDDYTRTMLFKDVNILRDRKQKILLDVRFIHTLAATITYPLYKTSIDREISHIVKTMKDLFNIRYPLTATPAIEDNTTTPEELTQQLQLLYVS